MEEVSGLQSVSLDIELDSDIHGTTAATAVDSATDKNEVNQSVISLFSFNDPPPCASDLIPAISENIVVNDLPKNGLQELELCLNPPSRGSMLNWEYVAAEFGFSNNKIMHLRTSVNPTAAVLQEIAFRPLKNLLHILGNINRIDALLSLQPYLESTVSRDNPETRNSSDSGAFVDAGKSDTLTFGGSFSGSFSSRNSSNSNIAAAGNQKFVLVTHHETMTNVALQKNYKWFLKNMRKQAKQAGMSIFDIDDYLEASCQFEGLHTLFANASSIVCVFTDDYLVMLRSTNSEQNIIIKQYLHKLMNAEFVEYGENRRFRAVTFQGTGRDKLPLGWAKTTLVYEFPAHHMQLFRKLFS